MSDTVPEVPRLYDLITVESTGSARAYAERLAREGADEGTLVWAKSQREGTGRKGKYWMSGYRNLHCAIVLRPDDAVENCCQLSLLATICAAMAISSQAEPLGEFRYRWPNDILLNGGKLASVTLGAQLSGPGVDWMVVALNANVYEHPQSKGFDAASMRGEGFENFDRVRLLGAYAREFLSWINRWSEEGFEPVRRAWLFNGHEEGDEVKVELPEHTVVGAFSGMDANGAIRLKTATDTESIELLDFFRPGFQRRQ